MFYADISQKYDVCVDMKPEMVEKKLKENPGIKAVVLTSPTYEGVVSDIKGIKKIILPSQVSCQHIHHIFVKCLHNNKRSLTVKVEYSYKPLYGSFCLLKSYLPAYIPKKWIQESGNKSGCTYFTYL